MSEYKEEIIDHYKNPRNMGDLLDADETINESNSSCGDIIQIKVDFDKDDQGEGLRLKIIKWQGVGCAISTATASMLSEKAIGMNKKELEEFGEGGVVEMLGGDINAGRIKCATLAYRGLLKVFENK